MRQLRVADEARGPADPRAPFGREYLMRLVAGAPRAFWRIDCAVSLAAAERMARLLEITGVHASFFVLTAGEFYNPHAESSLRHVAAIQAAGHRVGLCCDYRGYGGVVAAVERQRGLADFWTTDVVSFHRPPRLVLWRDFPGVDSVYGSRWRGRFVSDAGRDWSEAKAMNVRDGAQVCLHAEHWDL
jgi:peptidoglycan/xylan/chitin deacetylase (PgdA/CDA1 family)